MAPGNSILSFARDIRPLFRESDRDSMAFAFDLWDYKDVSTHAEDILERRTKHALHLTDKERADFTAWFQMLIPQPV